MKKSRKRNISIKTTVIAGMAMLAAAGAPSLRADLRSQLFTEYEVSSLDDAADRIVAGKKTGSAAAWYFSATKALLNYDFATAQKEFNECLRLAGKSATESSYIELANEALKGIKEGTQQFERFQDIVVIDSYEVDRDDLLKQLRLPLSAGRMIQSLQLPNKSNAMGEAAFVSESGDFMMWSEVDYDSAAPDEDAPMTMREVNVLADGTLSDPQLIEGLGEDPDFPFLTSDGLTLYYSAYGEGSVGGRDIFIASRDPQTGQYRAPVNAGFPFNSGADDYLLAIDEENGVGWWATDRRLLPDNKVTLYLFLLPDGRRNFEGSAEEKRARGVLEDFRVTWPTTDDIAQSESTEEADENNESSDVKVEPTQEELEARRQARIRSYQVKAADIRKIQPGAMPRRKECQIPVAPGKYIYSADDVKTPQQKDLVRKYIAAKKEYDELAAELDKSRRQYAGNPSDLLGKKIQSLEVTELKSRNELTSILSLLYKELR